MKKSNGLPVNRVHILGFIDHYCILLDILLQSSLDQRLDLDVHLTKVHAIHTASIVNVQQGTATSRHYT